MMKHIKTFEKYDNIIHGIKMSSESEISAFIEYHNINPLVMDIWSYCQETFSKYPIKLTRGGMVYGARNNTKVEFEFKTNGNIVLWHIKLQFNDESKSFDNTLIRSGLFSYRLLRTMFN